MTKLYKKQTNIREHILTGAIFHKIFMILTVKYALFG